MHTLADHFNAALALIEIGKERRDYAISAHTEIRKLLEGDATLVGWGGDTVLIGSYARETGIYPGKDVDVFIKLAKLSIDDTDPRTIYDATRRVLADQYGQRAEPQNRSIKVNFDQGGFEFSADVVPAVRMGDRWAIPRRDTAVWDDPEERWVETDPEHLGTLTKQQNKRLKVGTQGAYIPAVKLVRQTRHHHRDKAKPGGFYYELMTYWAFERGEVAGSSFAEIFAAALNSIAGQLASGDPLIDPVLEQDYRPAPDPADKAAAATALGDLAAKAREAVTTDDRCKAGALWRQILGKNEQGWCFPVPEGCDEYGRALPVTAVGASRGSREGGGFA